MQRLYAYTWTKVQSKESIQRDTQNIKAQRSKTRQEIYARAGVTFMAVKHFAYCYLSFLW